MRWGFLHYGPNRREAAFFFLFFFYWRIFNCVWLRRFCARTSNLEPIELSEAQKKKGTLSNEDTSLKPAILLHFDCVTHFKVGISHRVDSLLLCVESTEHKTSQGRLCHRLSVTWADSANAGVFRRLWPLAGPVWLRVIFHTMTSAGPIWWWSRALVC